MNGAKLSKGDINPDRLRVFGVILSRLEIGAIRIWHAGAWQRRLDCLTGGSHYVHVETRHGDLVTRFDDGVLRLGIKLRISILEEGVGSFAGLDVWAVVDELADRNMGGQFGHAAEM